MSKEDFFQTHQYSRMRDELIEILEKEKQQQLESPVAKLKAYWQVGHRLLKIKELREDEGLRVYLKKISQDLDIHRNTLSHILQFAQTWKKGDFIFKREHTLTWSHHVELLRLKDPAARHHYLQQSIARNWNRDTLRYAIKRGYFSPDLPTKQQKKALIPESMGRFYIYFATLLRVLDGDTVLVQIELGFHTTVSVVLRLRGINTPELGEDPSGRAEQAKSRLEEIFAQNSNMVVITYKTDVYGRYLADLYFHPTLTEKEAILENGIFVNQLLLDEGLAELLVM
ncbi:MAG: thermonuclease family protein [Deltaproteobacteria bacterium]|nr:thermonuclease family protein [Deltaproteobacteria bacterium]